MAKRCAGRFRLGRRADCIDSRPICWTKVGSYCKVAVESKENEIVAAPRLMKSLDLRGNADTSDALLAQRDLSVQIVETGSEYV